MIRLRLLAISVLVLTAVGQAGVAQSAPAGWPAHNLATGGPAGVADVDGLPDGRVATLLQRSTPRHTSSVELWIGHRRTVVATKGGAALAGKIAHDRRGRVVAVFGETGQGDDDGKVYVWTAAAGAQLLATGFNFFSDSVDVAVAPSGRAAVTISLYRREVRLARGTTSGGFASAPQTLPSSSPALSAQVGIADDGTVTAAYNDEWLARAPWSAPAVAAQLPAATLPGSPGHNYFALAVTGTGTGRAVIGQHAVVDLSTGEQETVSITTWDAGAAEPGTPVDIFRGHDSRLVAVATHDTAYLAWRAQARQSPVAATGIAAATVTPDGAIHHGFSIPGRGGAGPFQFRRPVIAPSDDGARVYFNVGGGIHTSRISRGAAVGGTTVVVRSGKSNPIVSATQAGGRPVIA